MFLIKLALKNLVRHKRRTIITASALAMGLVMYIIMDSLITGMFSQSNNNLKDAETGDGKILSLEAFEDRNYYPLSDRVRNPDYIMKLVASLGGKASKRVVSNGDMIFTDEYFPLSGSTQILFTAVDLETDNNVFNIFNNKFLVDGRFFSMGEDEVVIGSWLAEDTGAEIGDWFTLSLRTASDGDDPGYYQTIDVEIVGIVKVENPTINRTAVYFPLDSADYYLDLYGSVTEVAIRIPITAKLGDFQKILNTVIPAGYRYYTWREIADDYIKAIETDASGGFVIVILIVLIALVGITNTMLMTVNERQKELGMMRALGMSDRNIRIAFLFEAAGIGFIGSIIGVFLGILCNIPMVNTGLDYSIWLRDTDMGYKLSAYMKGAWDFASILGAFIMGIIIPVIVAIWPTRKAVMKSIPDCISGR